MIRVALRFDDPSVTSDASLEECIFDVLARCGVPATVAVIPFRWVGPQRVALENVGAAHIIRALEKRTIEVALHGNCHKSMPRQPRSEFEGLPAVVQKDKLSEGLLQLRCIFGDVVSGFVPPFNSYDASTAQCAASLGLSYLSAGWGGALTDELVLLPRTCQTAELREAIADARRFSRLAPIIIAVLHHYDFHESGAPEARFDLAQFETLLTWLVDQKDVQILTLGTLAAKVSSTAIHATLRRRLRFRQLHWRLQLRLPQKCMTTAGWLEMISCSLMK